MSSKNSYSIESYIADAKALSRLFPSLKKYKRRKTLKPQEKAAITRARNVFEAVGEGPSATPRKTRPPRLREYVYPANRKKKDTTYAKEARKLAALGFGSMDKYKGRKRFNASEKAAITRARKKSRYITDEYVRLKKKPKFDIRFKIPGLNAIKLRNVEVPTKDNKIKRKIEFTDYGLAISIKFPNGLKRFYKFVYTGSNIDALIDTGTDLLEEGAKVIAVWLNHGVTDQSFSTIQNFAASLGEVEAVREVSERVGIAPNRIVSGGYAVAYEEAEQRKDDGKVELAEVPWIYGVVGTFETRSRKNNPHTDYSF